MSQVLKKLVIEPYLLMNICVDAIDSTSIQKATKASMSSSKSKKEAKWVKERQKRHNGVESISADFEAYQDGGH